MSHYEFKCTECSKSHIADPRTLRCESCSGTLSVTYTNWKRQVSSLVGGGTLDMPIPLGSLSEYLSLGEGNTPVISMPKISSMFETEIYGKLEFMNPTGSFKDRGTAMMISALKSKGVSEIVEDSSGNAGASVSAYATRAGMKAHIFAPLSAPQTKLNQIKVYGSILHAVDGSRDETTEAAEEFVKHKSIVYASHNLSPFFIEGTKTFGYEIFNDFDREIPGNIVVPVGNESLYLGIWKALEELKERRLIKTLPKLHCIQAENINPIASNNTWNKSKIKSTVAGGIAVGSPPRKSEVQSVLHQSGGTANSVTEASIVEWQIKLAKHEGLFCEPTSAAAFAGLENLINSKHINKNERVLIPITGSGLKDVFPE